MGVEVVSLDCGDTLIHRVRDHHLVIFDILRSLGYELDVDRVRYAFEEARLWWREERRRTGRVWDEEARISMIGKMLSIIGLPCGRSLASTIGDLWLEKAEYKAYDDVESTLKTLKSLGYRLIVISNSSSKRSLELNLRRTGLLGYFEVLVSSGSVGYEKPHPEIFRIASRLCGVQLDRMVHIGNDYEDDYVGALGVGMKAILLDREDRYAGRNCVRVRRLVEVPNIIEKLC